ncbi:MAG TPA: cytochrome C oxidase subunit II [Nitrospinota bacterium]|nr:cytochrome C oxidase subunit II [Nitrospinota bacterium]|tara:strand:+ start:2884 stop:3411 length:528 start_codon:yes stop_codon:yes gene_type:complete
MSVQSLQPGWWKTPVHKEERIWITVALIWCILMTLIMPLWHVVGEHNPSAEYYRIAPEDFDKLTDEFIDKYKVGVEGDFAVVEPPAGADIFLRGSQWQWDPVLKLKVNETYRLHLSSIDVLHGMSIYPINLNFEAVPGYDYVLTITPTSTGTFNIICNEFCGISHHNMMGKIIVQ